MFKQTYPRTLASLDAVIEDVRTALAELKLPQKKLVHALLLTEECAASLIENVDQRRDEPLEVVVRKRFGDISVRITAAGEEYDPTMEVPLGTGDDDPDRDIQSVLRSRILRAYDSELSHSYKNNRNVVILTHQEERPEDALAHARRLRGGDHLRRYPSVRRKRGGHRRPQRQPAHAD